jgi:predicted DNA-binding transcriptional regulator AlpA
VTPETYQGPTLDPNRIYSGRQVAHLLGVHISTVYEWLKTDPTFPKPVRLGQRVVRWTGGQIADYIRARSPAEGA